MAVLLSVYGFFLGSPNVDNELSHATFMQTKHITGNFLLSICLITCALQSCNNTESKVRDSIYTYMDTSLKSKSKFLKIDKLEILHLDKITRADFVDAVSREEAKELRNMRDNFHLDKRMMSSVQESIKDTKSSIEFNKKYGFKYDYYLESLQRYIGMLKDYEREVVEDSIEIAKAELSHDSLKKTASSEWYGYTAKCHFLISSSNSTKVAADTVIFMVNKDMATEFTHD